MLKNSHLIHLCTLFDISVAVVSPVVSLAWMKNSKNPNNKNQSFRNQTTLVALSDFVSLKRTNSITAPLLRKFSSSVLVPLNIQYFSKNSLIVISVWWQNVCVLLVLILLQSWGSTSKVHVVVLCVWVSVGSLCGAQSSYSSQANTEATNCVCLCLYGWFYLLSLLYYFTQADSSWEATWSV